MNAEPIVVYLGLGSNMGDRQQNLERALDYLSQRLRVGKVSSIYDTEPWGDNEQPRFLNMVCEVSTRLTPEALLGLARGIESKMGRKGGHGDPRPIDIDILLYGDMVTETQELAIPHPGMTERAFVLIPFAEIAPDTVHPVTGRTVKQLLQDIKAEQGVFKLDAG